MSGSAQNPMPPLHPLHAIFALLVMPKQAYMSVNSNDFACDCQKFDEISSEMIEKKPETEPFVIKARPPMFDMIREFAYGLKLGARHSIDTRHHFAERAVRPSVTAAMKNEFVGTEQSGR